MKTRVRLIMNWIVTFAPEGMPFSKLDDYYAHARGMLVDRFAHYGAELSISVKDRIGDSMAELALTWDVDLDGVAGAYHFPRDHEAHARHHLVDGIKLFAYRLKVEILRFPDAENDIDGATEPTPWSDDYYARRYDAFVAQMKAEEAAAAA